MPSANALDWNLQKCVSDTPAHDVRNVLRFLAEGLDSYPERELSLSVSATQGLSIVLDLCVLALAPLENTQIRIE